MRMRINRFALLKMEANTSSSLLTHPDNSDGNDSSSSSISGNGLITKTKSVKSVVWKYFGYKDEDAVKKEIAICRTCRKAVAARGGNTSNLISHLKIHHPLKHEEFRKLNAESQHSTTARSKTDGKPQTSIVDSIKATQKYDRNSRKWQKLTDAVTYCIGKDMLPVYTVEKEGFANLLKQFDPQYELPSRKYFSKTAIPKLYESTRESVLQNIRNLTFYSATTDMWSSINGDPYMSYTIHYITEEWELRSTALGTLYFPQNHTGENISDAIRETLESWKLDSKNQVCLTTDNGSNILCAVKTILGWTHLPCFGHNLHLAIGHSIKDDTRIDRAVGVCKKLVSTFSYSFKKKRDLTEAQREYGLPEHSLVTDCQTRWGSTQRMIGRVLEQEKAIRKVLGSDRKTSHLVPTWQDLDVLESLNAALNPLSDFTDMLSAEDYVSVSAVLPVLKILHKDICNISDDETSLTSDIKCKVLDYLDDKYSDPLCRRLLSLACFLDPRFVTDYIPEDVGMSAITNWIVEEGVKFVPSEDRHAGCQTTGSSQDITQEEPVHKRRKLSSYLRASKKQAESEDDLTPESYCKAELKRYMTISKPDPESKPLQWWKMNHMSFPILSQLARKYLSICASSSASERLFSTAGNISTKKRNSLKPDKLNMLVFLARNL